MSTAVGLRAGAVGVTVLEGATPEALTSVADSWFEGHAEAEIHSVTLQASPAQGGSLFLLVVHDRIRGLNSSPGSARVGFRR